MNKRKIQLQDHLKVHQSKVPYKDLAPHTKKVHITIQKIEQK